MAIFLTNYSFLPRSLGAPLVTIDALGYIGSFSSKLVSYMSKDRF